MKVIFRKCKECGLEAHTEEELELFKKDKKSKYGRSTTCKECDREISKNWNSNNKEKVREKIKRNREALKEYLGGSFKCKHCGFEHPTSAPFDFHHLHPEDKEAGIGRLVQYATLERLFKEVDKCVLLCKTCHAIEHERLRDDSDF